MADIETYTERKWVEKKVTLVFSRSGYKVPPGAIVHAKFKESFPNSKIVCNDEDMFVEFTWKEVEDE